MGNNSFKESRSMQISKELKYFFNSVIEKSKDYDYIVITTRRCALLFFAYLEETDNKEIQNKVITDYKLLYYASHIKESFILLIDDILIHGRTVKDICKLLIDLEYPYVSLYVYMYNREAEMQVSDWGKMGVNVEYFKSINRTGWKETSNFLVEEIKKAELPYVTFTPVFVNKYIEDEVIEIQQNMEEYALLNKLCVSMSMRRHRVVNKVYDIPLVFLKPYDFKDSGLIYKELGKHFKKMCPKISDIFKAVPPNELVYESLEKYKAVLLTFVLSYLYYKVRYTEYDNQCALQDLYALTFPKDVLEELKLIDNKKAKALLGLELDTTIKSLPYENLYIDKDLYKNEKDVEAEDLIALDYEIDEERSKNRQERLKGYTIKYLLTNFNETDTQKGERILKKCIMLWGKGQATYTIKICKVMGRKYVIGYTCASEQAYRLYYDKGRGYLQGILYYVLEMKRTGKDFKRDFDNYIAEVSPKAQDKKLFHNVVRFLKKEKNMIDVLRQVNVPLEIENPEVFEATYEYLKNKVKV